MWQLGKRFSGEHSGDGLMVGLSPLEGLLQPQGTSNSISCMLKTNLFTNRQGMTRNFLHRSRYMTPPFGNIMGICFLGVSGSWYCRVQLCLRLLLTLFQQKLSPACGPMGPFIFIVEQLSCGTFWIALLKVTDQMSVGGANSEVSADTTSFSPSYEMKL